jgi:hypothetical protein
MAEPLQTAFSSSAEDAISRTLPVKPESINVPNPTTREELAQLEELYEVEWTASEITQGGYRQVRDRFL